MPRSKIKLEAEIESLRRSISGLEDLPLFANALHETECQLRILEGRLAALRLKGMIRARPRQIHESNRQNIA